MVGLYQSDPCGIGVTRHNRGVGSGNERRKERCFPIVRRRQARRRDLRLVRIPPVVIRSNDAAVAVMECERGLLQRVRRPAAQEDRRAHTTPVISRASPT